jgi:RNA polymerase primary sigma factor
LKKSSIKKSFVTDENLTLYLRDIARYKPLPSEEEVKLAILIKKDDKNALEKLVKSNLRFVVSVARNYQNQGLPLADLINDGNVGLMRAAKRFDAKKNFKFISYAVWWIRQGILQSLADHSRLLRLPINRVATIYKVGKASSKLEQKLSRLPNSQEIADELGVSETDVMRSIRAGSNHTSLDAPIKKDAPRTFLDMLYDENIEKPDDYALNNYQTKRVKKLLNVLSERQKLIIRLYFGIDEEACYTLDEIGKRLNLTRERIRQIKDGALSKLKRSVLRYQFSDYVT